MQKPSNHPEQLTAASPAVSSCRTGHHCMRCPKRPHSSGCTKSGRHLVHSTAPQCREATSELQPGCSLRSRTKFLCQLDRCSHSVTCAAESLSRTKCEPKLSQFRACKSNLASKCRCRTRRTRCRTLGTLPRLVRSHHTSRDCSTMGKLLAKESS